MVRTLLIVLPLLLAPAATAQELDVPAILRGIETAADQVKRRELGPGKGVLATEIFMREHTQAIGMAAHEAMQRWRPQLAKGDGVYLHARLLDFKGEKDKAFAMADRYVDGGQQNRFYNDALLLLARLGGLHGKGAKHALWVFKNIDPEKLSSIGEGKRYRATAERMREYEFRAILHGQKPPALDNWLLIDDDHQAGEGTSFDLGRYTGDPVVVLFMSSWIPSCHAALKDLIERQKAHAGAVRMVAVTSFVGRAPDMSQVDPRNPLRLRIIPNLDRVQETFFLEKLTAHYGLAGFPLVIEHPGRARRNWGVVHQPCLFVLGRDGKVLGHVIGEGLLYRKQLGELIDRALAN